VLGDDSSAWSAEAWGNDPDDGAFGHRWDETMSDIEAELGPVDYLVVAFPGRQGEFLRGDGSSI